MLLGCLKKPYHVIVCVFQGGDQLPSYDALYLLPRFDAGLGEVLRALMLRAEGEGDETSIIEG